jgi:hypothetical protein
MQPCGKTWPRAEGQGIRTNLFLHMKSWILSYFKLKKLQVVSHIVMLMQLLKFDV